MTRTETAMVELIEKARNGDADAFGELYTLYFTPVYRYIHIRVGRRQDADDMAQTVFLKAWQAIGRFENTGKPFLAWLFTIARNTVYDHYKKKKEVLLGDLPPRDIPDPTEETREEQEQIDEEHTLIRTQMRMLSPDQQDVLALRFMEGRSHREISQLMGKSEDAVRALASRGLRELRRLVLEAAAAQNSQKTA